MWTCAKLIMPGVGVTWLQKSEKLQLLVFG